MKPESPFLKELAGRPLVVAGCLAALTFLLFFPVRDFEFIGYDDGDYVAQNPVVQAGLTARGVAWAFTTFHAGNWHPVTWLSLMLDVQLAGPDPTVFHLLNALWHAANTVLLWLVLRRLTSSTWRSLLVASLFAAHPLHVESVAWISERKDLLCAFFMLLALMFYTRHVESLPKSEPPRFRFTRAYGFCITWFVLGLMSKPMLVTFPFVLLLLDYWPLKRFQKGNLAPVILEKIPFLALSAISSVITVIAQSSGGAVKSLEHFTLASRVANALVSYGTYLAKTVWPTKLAIFYPHPGNWPAGQVIGALLILSVLTVAVWIYRKRAPFAFVGWLWFIGMLVPVIGLVQVGIQAMADRYTYLPSIGLFVAFAWGLGKASEGLPVAKSALSAFALCVVALCAVCARAQVATWRSDITLFSHAVAVTARNPLAHNNLADALLRQGRAAEAIPHYRAVIALNSNYVHAYNNLGAALTHAGRTNEALQVFETAVSVDPRFFLAQLNLADALAAQGRFPEAIARYKIALEVDPGSLRARTQLARAFQNSGNNAAALAMYEETVRIYPNDVAVHDIFGRYLLGIGELPRAEASFSRALKLDPEDVAAHIGLAEVLLKTSRPQDARAHAQEAVRLRPENPDAQFVLGQCLSALGDTTGATNAFNEAARLKRGNFGATDALQRK